MRKWEIKTDKAVYDVSHIIAYLQSKGKHDVFCEYAAEVLCYLKERDERRKYRKERKAYIKASMRAAKLDAKRRWKP